MTTPTLSRRTVLAGLASLPVLAHLGSLDPPPVVAAPAAPELGKEQRYHAPLLCPGARLVFPAGLTVASIQDFYRRPRLVAARSVWPHVRAANGSMVDASIVPEPGAPTRVAVLSGFTEGWYELHHATGRSDRVTWHARAFPFLWLYGEFGGAHEEPYRGRFFTLALQPLSHNPYRSA